jgi:ABC-type antimicrobial peptide transport system permease subunit
MISREALLLVTIGAALGTLTSLAANGYIAGQLFGVTPRDPVAIAVALSVLGIVTVVAGYIPARRASRIDPVRALRAE